jgi:radical SAM superfamily enzyme YgiQ (UPF0313 family)
MPSKGTVVLYMPHYVAPGWGMSPDYLATPPLPYLAMGRPLRDAGYDVRIIDAKWEPRYREEIAACVGQAVCFGVSGMTGYSVKDGLEMSGLVKSLRPDLPVVWGGWHSSFVTGQAAKEPRVDVLVKGQGERSFVEVLDALREKRSLAGVRGIAFRDGEAMIETPDRLPEDVNAFPPFDYSLVDPARYVRRGPGVLRLANTIFSRGCPYQCDFCLDSRQKWFGLSLERMRAEMEFWVEGQGANHLRFYDGNFFLGRDRLHAIAGMILGSSLAGNFLWTATGVASRLVKLDGEVLDYLRRSGCHQVAIGAETGSDELLQQITNKTTVEQTTEAVRVLTRHGINQYLFFMVGYPDEPEGTLEKTLRLVCRLKEINPELELQMNFCVPLPGSQMFKIAVAKGLFPEPKRFEDWGDLDVNHANLPHITAEYERKAKRFLEYLLLAYPKRYRRDSLLERALANPIARAAYAPVGRLARWRIENQSFVFPVETALYKAMRTWRSGRLAASAGAG